MDVCLRFGGYILLPFSNRMRVSAFHLRKTHGIALGAQGRFEEGWGSFKEVWGSFGGGGSQSAPNMDQKGMQNSSRHVLSSIFRAQV